MMDFKNFIAENYTYKINHFKDHSVVSAWHKKQNINKLTTTDMATYNKGHITINVEPPPMSYGPFQKKFEHGELPKNHDHKNIVGYAVINKKKPEKQHAEILVVHHKHRGKGIATAMYDHYEKEANTKLKPAKHQSKSGKKFWEKRKNQ